jgi:soluble lytic murein transglycosylase-like protein
MRITLLALVSVIMAAAAAWGQTEVYTYVDENGTVHFTDMPRVGAKSFYVGNRLVFARSTPLTQRLANGEIPYASTLTEAAGRYGLDAELLAAVAQVESSFNPYAVSPKGAKGIMQLMDSTAAAYGVTDVFDPSQNIDAAARHLRDLLRAFDGNLSLTLAAYNAGRSAVARHGGVPPYQETRRYLEKIGGLYGGLEPGITDSEFIGSYTVAQAIAKGRSVVYRFYTEAGVNYSENPPIGRPYEEVRLHY